jgi:hypothetical protein
MDSYCGKMMYDEDQARKVVKHSKGVLKGFYYCDACQANHVTSQRSSPSRQKWFDVNNKLFRNKHR